MTSRAMLCPRCRRIIGTDETTCSWCGWRRPRWNIPGLRRGALDGDFVVRAIITANVIFFLLSLLIGRQPTTSFLGALSPNQGGLLVLGATGTIPVFRFDAFWSLISASYLHGGILHLIFNLAALRQIAPMVEREYGVSRMFVIYTLGGVCGYIASLLARIPFTIGASAAVCGLIGALLYYGKSRGGAYGSAVYRETTGWITGLVLFGLMVPSINNWAHGGGIVGGVLLGMLLGYEDRRRENLLHRLVALLCAAATVVILVWRGIEGLGVWLFP